MRNIFVSIQPLIFIVLALWIPGAALAQTGEHTFLGILTLDGNSTPYSYKIQFHDSGSTITGISVTDLQGKDQTKTNISGSLNHSGKRISFREAELVSTSSTADRDSFCYIHADLKLAKHKGAEMLKGKFTGYMMDGKTECGRGQLLLVSKDNMLEKLMALGPQADTLVKLVQKIDAETPKPPAPIVHKLPTAEKKPEHIDVGTIATVKAGTARYMACPGDTIHVELWDNEKVDGDIISLLHNKKPVLNQYRITDKREHLTIRLAGKQREILELVAVNEGMEPPVTVRMRCTCGDKTYILDASSSIGQPVSLQVR